MKKCLTYLFAVSFFIASASCRKTAESIVDCLSESAALRVTYQADPANPKRIDFQVKYSGNNSVGKVDWVFGDGTTASVNGTTTSHTFMAAGRFSVKARIQVVKGNSSCTSEPVKEVTVN